MEIRASYLFVGSVVLILVAALAGFSVWLVRADIEATVRYEIAFEGSVTGLQEGNAVRYRGVPIGRVQDIRIDPENVEQVLVTVDVERGTPIKEDTIATLELQGITGIAYVQLRGGTQESPPIEPKPGPELARIPSRPSALEQVFEQTPDLLTSGVALVERMTKLLNDDNLSAVAATLENVEAFTDALADDPDAVRALITDAADAAARIEQLSTEMSGLAADLRAVTGRIDERVEGVGGDLVATLTELQSAASALGAAAGQLDGMIGDIREPMDDFAGSGLYEFSQLIGESRVLIAALNRITKEFERDPAGFFIGSQGGFEAE